MSHKLILWVVWVKTCVDAGKLIQGHIVLSKLIPTSWQFADYKGFFLKLDATQCKILETQNHMISCFSVFLWSINIYFPPIVVSSSFWRHPWCQTRLRRSLEILTFGQKRFSRNNVPRQLRQIFNRTTSRTLSRCNVLTISYFQNIFNIQTIFLMQHFRANIEHHFFATFSFVDIFKTLPRCNICKPMLTLLPFPFNKIV